MPHPIHLLVGIIHIGNPVYKPSVAIGIGVLYGNGLPRMERNDDILRVEHVQNGVERVAIDLRHVAASRC